MTRLEYALSRHGDIGDNIEGSGDAREVVGEGGMVGLVKTQCRSGGYERGDET